MRIAVLVTAGIAALVGILLVLPHGSDGVPAPAAVARPPAPPAGALVLARQDGRLAVGLAVRGRALMATVLSPDGGGLRGAAVTFRSAGQSVRAKACGPGCYRASLAHDRSVQVGLRGSTVGFRLPATAPSGTGLVRRASRVIRGLRSLTLDERISSGLGRVVRTRFVLVAPHSLSVTQPGGNAAIVIGKLRWDRVGRGPWVRSAQSPLDEPSPFWDDRFTNARIVSRRHGIATVSFLNPRLPAWFEARIDERTGRTLGATMVAASHFMNHRYSRFNAPERIRPPR